MDTTNPLIDAVSDEQVSCRAEMNVVREVQTGEGRLTPISAEACNAIAGDSGHYPRPRVNPPNAAVVDIGNIDVAVRVEGHIPWCHAGRCGWAAISAGYCGTCARHRGDDISPAVNFPDEVVADIGDEEVTLG